MWSFVILCKTTRFNYLWERVKELAHFQHPTTLENMKKRIRKYFSRNNDLKVRISKLSTKTIQTCLDQFGNIFWTFITIIKNLFHTFSLTYLDYIPIIIDFFFKYFNAKLFSSVSIDRTSKKYPFPLKTIFLLVV